LKGLFFKQGSPNMTNSYTCLWSKTGFPFLGVKSHNARVTELKGMLEPSPRSDAPLICCSKAPKVFVRIFFPWNENANPSIWESCLI
jgi:hypothetical protein